MAKKRRVPAIVVNGRMSDHSSKGYYRMRLFFSPILRSLSMILVQTEADKERYLAVSPKANVQVTGNMKFDQSPPENIGDPGLAGYFGDDNYTILLAASTHPGEEDVVGRTYKALKEEFPLLRLVIVPRHAERGADVASVLEKDGLSVVRRSQAEKAAAPVDVLVADTTGEMFKFINAADIVIMGKSLAGHDEGHNLIEPALLDKPVVTGSVLRNFRFILDVLKQAEAVVTVSDETELAAQLRRLVADPELRAALGKRGGDAIRQHRGAMERAVNFIESTGCGER